MINITYEIADSTGKIRITVKDKIKKAIGSSPDRADAFAYGLWITDHAEEWSSKDKYLKDKAIEYEPEFT